MPNIKVFEVAEDEWIAAETVESAAARRAPQSRNQQVSTFASCTIFTARDGTIITERTPNAPH